MRYNSKLTLRLLPPPWHFGKMIGRTKAYAFVGDFLEKSALHEFALVIPALHECLNIRFMLEKNPGDLGLLQVG